MINMGMSVRNYRAFAGALGCVLLLTACGDLGMVLPSQGSYRVNAQVDGDYTLDIYSVVTKNSQIRPYFVNSVINDPDVRGLTVFVQDYSGVVVSRKVHYRLVESVKEEPKPANEPETFTATPDPAAEEGPEAGADEVSQDEPSEDEPPEDEAAMPDEADEELRAEAAGPAEEIQPELPGPEFDDPAVEAPEDFPAEPPEDSFGGNDAGDTWAAADVAVEAETETAGWADATYAAGAAGGSTGADIPGQDAAGAAAADLGFTSADAPGQDATSTDTAESLFPGTGAAGSDSGNTDTVDTATADTNTAGSGAAGADAPGGDTGAVSSDSGNTDTVETAAADTNTAGFGAVGTDAAGGDTGAVVSDAGNTDTVETAAADTNTAGFGAAGANATGADAADTGIAAPAAPPVETPKPPIPEDETVTVKQLDQYLPAFRIVEELDIGRYNLVFQVMGEKEILYRTFKPIYFIGDAKFTLEEIQSFLPVAITGGRLIPPGINVMLGTEVSADPRLDPYVIWHNGKKILAQGRLSDGANYLMWKTPEQTGFHSIRAEVFPLLPGDRMPGNMIGKIKELSLPVSLKSEGIRYFSDPSDEFINWYQLWGTLDDAKAPNNAERRLVSLYSQAPRWKPLGGMYGLLVGDDDIYILPGTPFKLSGDTQGTGRILFRLAPLLEGVILNIYFSGGESAAQADVQETAASPMGTAELDLSFAGNALILRIASGSASLEESLELNDNEAKGFITVIVEFAIAPDHFEAELRLEDPAGTTGPLSIALAAPISGEGSLYLGGANYPGHGRNLTRQASGGTGIYGNGTMALNELALSYARLPAPQKDEVESGIQESLIAEEEDLSVEPEPSSPNAL
jgi:hypothetical protein